MQFRPRHLIIRWVLPLIWKFDRGQKARLLYQFAHTELDSAWQSIFALSKFRDPETRSLLFKHAFEELHHCDLFLQLARAQAGPVASAALTRREPIVNFKSADKKEAVEFLAFLAIGESEIQRDFKAYQAALPEPEVQRLFQSLREDECEHAEVSGRALAELAKDQGFSLRWTRIRHLGSLSLKRHNSIMQRLGVFIMTLILFFIYIVFGSLVVGQARSRMKLSPDKQLQLLRDQQLRFKKRCQS